MVSAEAVQKKATFVIDTNVLLNDLYALHELAKKGASIVIPIAVLREVDQLKKDSKRGVEKQAHNALLFIEKNMNGCLTMQSHEQVLSASQVEQFFPKVHKFNNDDQILSSALFFDLNSTPKATFLLTRDLALKIKARSFGILTFDDLNSFF